MEVININVAITCWVVFWITYWISGILLTWKAHVDGKRKVTHLSEVVSNLIVNMMWSLFAVIILTFLPLRAWTDSHILIKLVGTYIVTDVYFFHVHIMLHQSQLYKPLHKLHHKFQAPFAIAALYSTGYEMVILNTFAGGLGPIIFQLPSPYLYIWFVITSLNAVCTHSGYTFSFLIDGEHDYHHVSFKYNYGVSNFLDKLYGTYRDPLVEYENKKKELEEQKQEGEEEQKQEQKESTFGNFPISDISFEE